MASIKFIHRDDEELKITGKEVVPKELSAKLTNSKGEVIYYVDRNYGLGKGWISKMNFKNSHPLKPNLVELKFEIERD